MPNETRARMAPMMKICRPMPRLKILSSGANGGRRMVSFSVGSSPKANPGTPSVTRFIHRIYNVVMGRGMAKNCERNITVTSAELLVTMKLSQNSFRSGK
jgi:hypothetical protein